MRKSLKVSMLLTLSVGILFACSNEDGVSSNSNSVNEDNNQKESDVTDTDEDKNDDQNDNSSEDNNYGMPDKQGTEDEDSEKEESEINFGEGETDDQLDLSIGDTGLIETNMDKFAITLNNLVITEELQGVNPNDGFDQFILANVTISNEHSASINLEDVVEILETTVLLDGSGYGEASGRYDLEIDGFSGELEPGDSITGDLLFDTPQSNEYFLRVTEGLISASAVKNQVIWTFTEEEAD